MLNTKQDADDEACCQTYQLGGCFYIAIANPTQYQTDNIRNTDVGLHMKTPLTIAAIYPLTLAQHTLILTCT